MAAIPAPAPNGRGWPRRDDRLIVEAILWRLATGAPWRNPPARFGPWKTAYSRFRRSQRVGVWDKRHRTIATRCEKPAETGHALLAIACILLWL